MLQCLKDWWRGYSDADIVSARDKLDRGAPGGIVKLSQREMRASLSVPLYFLPHP